MLNNEGAGTTNGKGVSDGAHYAVYMSYIWYRTETIQCMYILAACTKCRQTSQCPPSVLPNASDALKSIEVQPDIPGSIFRYLSLIEETQQSHCIMMEATGEEGSRLGQNSCCVALPDFGRPATNSPVAADAMNFFIESCVLLCMAVHLAFRIVLVRAQ